MLSLHYNIFFNFYNSCIKSQLDSNPTFLQQKGLFDVPDEGVSHSVTPLWAAAVSGRLAVVKTLLRHGADVDAVSDSGSTPVRSACYIVRPGIGIGGSSNHLVRKPLWAPDWHLTRDCWLLILSTKYNPKLGSARANGR